MSTRTFTAEWLEAHHIDDPFSCKLVVHREFGENQDYGTTWTAVFLHDGKHWQVTYQTPLGEAHADTWFDEDEVTAVEVRPQGKFITEWVPVKPHHGGRCKAQVLFAPSDRLTGTCGMDAPFLLAVRNGDETETLERCIAHAHAALTSMETFPLIEEVRRRWH